MKIRNKLYTVAVCFVVLLLLAGFGAFKPKTASGGQKTSDADQGISGSEQTGKTADSGVSGQKKIKYLGGVDSRMPENSALVFFGSTFGMKLTSYKAYKNFDEAICALKSGEADAIWACDLSTDYLLKVNDGLVRVDADQNSDIQKTKDARFSFGMALKKGSGEALRDEINIAIGDMKADGTLAELVNKYVDNAENFETEQGEKERFYPDKMRKKTGKGTITVGITGAVPPLELLDKDMQPYGFCVAMMDEIGARTGKNVKFVYLDNETAFTSLMGGRVDLLFTYGTGYVTTEAKPGHIMTDGYLEMQRYELIQNEVGR